MRGRPKKQKQNPEQKPQEEKSSEVSPKEMETEQTESSQMPSQEERPLTLQEQRPLTLQEQNSVLQAKLLAKSQEDVNFYLIAGMDYLKMESEKLKNAVNQLGLILSKEEDLDEEDSE